MAALKENRRRVYIYSRTPKPFSKSVKTGLNLTPNGLGTWSESSFKILLSLETLCFKSLCFTSHLIVLNIILINIMKYYIAIGMP